MANSVNSAPIQDHRITDPVQAPAAIKTMGLHFRLPHGLPASLYRLDNRKVLAAATTCEKAWFPLQIERRNWPDQYVTAIRVNSETVYLVYSYYYLLHLRITIKELVSITKKNLLRAFEAAAVLVYNDEAIPPLSPKGKILIRAIENNLSPHVCTLLFSQQDR
jgi:hypothetical protein